MTAHLNSYKCVACIYLNTTAVSLRLFERVSIALLRAELLRPAQPVLKLDTQALKSRPGLQALVQELLLLLNLQYNAKDNLLSAASLTKCTCINLHAGLYMQCM